MATNDLSRSAMSMPGYKVTPGDVNAAATYVDNRAADIDSKISTLGTYVAGLSEFWQGSAHTAFETLMADYTIYARMLHNALADVAGGLRGNYVNYIESENTNLGNIHKVALPPAKF